MGEALSEARFEARLSVDSVLLCFYDSLRLCFSHSPASYSEREGYWRRMELRYATIKPEVDG